MTQNNQNNDSTIVWFRQDLRINDNPALLAAAKKYKNIYPIYIFDKNQQPTMGEASKWWLHQSLEKLSAKMGNKLAYFSGDPINIIQKLVEQTGASAVYWNRLYEPYTMERDTAIKSRLQALNIDAKSFSSFLLREPHKLLKKDGTPFKVFTPFYKQMYLVSNEEIPDRVRDDNLAEANRIEYFSAENPNFNLAQCPSSAKLEELQLLPKKDWHHKLEEHWQPGEDAALTRFEEFLDSGLQNYKEDRNRPDLPNSTSCLSPHIHFGEISVRYIWHTVATMLDSAGFDKNYEHFLSELVWREFSYYLLHHFPELPTKNWATKFDAFPWHKDGSALKAWQLGQTGYPFVDAAMRELWQTGFMHNRTRMVAGSFLVKHLLLDWREGERWFWDCLVDADIANNSASWQWVAGCGADAAPYFRIFNPIMQGHKFDPEGIYTRRLVPELKELPTKYLFSPWEAPEEVLNKAGVVLGKTYPHPIVDHAEAREKALAAYAKTKGG